MADLEFILNHAKEVNADAIVCSGDFFEKPVQPGSVMTPLIKLLKQNTIPIYTTVGQHDTNGHNCDDYGIKSLGQLDAYGLVKVLIHGEAEDLGYVIIRGYGFNDPETDDLLSGKMGRPDPNAAYGYDGNETVFEIALVHASVGADETMVHQGISQQSICAADLALFGDIHQGFEPYEFPSGCLALGLGSLGRRRIDDYGRVAQFAVIRIDNQLDFELEFISLPGLPDEDIFIAPVEISEEAVDTAAVFKEEWDKAVAVHDMTPQERARRLGELMVRAGEISQEAAQLVLSYMPEAE